MIRQTWLALQARCGLDKETPWAAQFLPKPVCLRFRVSRGRMMLCEHGSSGDREMSPGMGWFTGDTLKGFETY